MAWFEWSWRGRANLVEFRAEQQDRRFLCNICKNTWWESAWIFGSGSSQSPKGNNSLSILMAIFIGEPWLASFIRAKDDGVVVVTNGAISCAELHSNHQQQDITQHLQARCPFLSPNQQCHSTVDIAEKFLQAECPSWHSATLVKNISGMFHTTGATHVRSAIESVTYQLRRLCFLWHLSSINRIMQQLLDPFS